MLRKVSNFDSAAVFHLASGRFQFSSQHFHQSGFAGAVWPDDSDAVSTLQKEIKAAENLLVAISDAHILAFNDFLAEALALHRQFKRRIVVFFLDAFFDFIKTLNTRLLLGGTRFRSAANPLDRKSTRLNSSHVKISYAVFCLKKKKKTH